MRTCQICGSKSRQTVQDNYSGQPVTLFECLDCGHWYVDGDKLSQAWFDNYYLTQYKTDDKPYSDARLNSLADYVASIINTRKINNIADIGGTDGELRWRLRERGVIAWTYGVNDEQPDQWNADAVILSHTLEHIYDIGTMFDKIDRFLHGTGWLVVEIPIHLGYNLNYDVHWQHINKFRQSDIERLFEQKGYKVRMSQRIEDYREYNCWRIAGEKVSNDANS